MEAIVSTLVLCVVGILMMTLANSRNSGRGLVVLLLALAKFTVLAKENGINHRELIPFYSMVIVFLVPLIMKVMASYLESREELK